MTDDDYAIFVMWAWPAAATSAVIMVLSVCQFFGWML